MPVKLHPNNKRSNTRFGGVSMQEAPTPRERLFFPAVKEFGYENTFKEHPVSSHESGKKQYPGLFRVVEYRDFICFRLQPHLHWLIDHDVRGTQPPQELRGRYSTDKALKDAIDRYLSLLETT